MHMDRSTHRQQLVEELLDIVKKEYRNGNPTVSAQKYKALLELQHNTRQPPLPAPLYPPLFHKFQLPKPEKPPVLRKRRTQTRTWLFKHIELVIVAILESLANLLDTMHIFSRMPMFPPKLAALLKHTNRMWVLVLLFLIRKTLSQFRNVRRKENKVLTELGILRTNANAKLLQHTDDNIEKRYEKVLKDLRFDKMMLKIELVGNFLDLVFNAIELYRLPVPQHFMNLLSFTSMAMLIYRMNKDDEYMDDDISEDVM